MSRIAPLALYLALVALLVVLFRAIR